MKTFGRLIIGLALLLLIFLTIIYGYLVWQRPQYSGTLQLKGLENDVEIIFDEFAIPHIYAKNEPDAFFALGYVHAQERLFQMDMMRRVAAGRLSEVFGKELIQTDKFFRTLDLNEQAIRSAQQFLNDSLSPMQLAARAYLKGVNMYIERGKTPVEYVILGIPKEKFEPEDIYRTVGLMAFNFALAFQTDPIIESIRQKKGADYLKDFALHHRAGQEVIPVNIPENNFLSALPQFIESLRNTIPVPMWQGSNGFVISPEKSKSGFVLFENDAHMQFSQPCVWYEAHLECPEFSFYGNFLAGFPFAPLGHNRKLAWGLTMFLNDDVDFYVEKTHDADSALYLAKGVWKKFDIRNETIKVKDDSAHVFTVRSTYHGPVISDVFHEVDSLHNNPVSVWWTYLKFPSTLAQASYDMAHAKNIQSFEKAVSLIDAPGLNVMYGDVEGNIAWWAAARLLQRPLHVEPLYFLDGSSGKDDPIGYYFFSVNPKSINPPEGFVYSANNQPGSSTGMYYPGYYAPDNRASRLAEWLSADGKFSSGDIKSFSYETVSPVHKKAADVITALLDESLVTKSANHKEAALLLKSWTGEEKTSMTEPVIFYKLLYNVMKLAMTDEIGTTDFERYIGTHNFKNTYPVLLSNDESLWWDDVTTEKQKETRKNIFNQAFDQTIEQLIEQLGTSMQNWNWGTVHPLVHGHIIGRQRPFDLLFNVGPYAMNGGNETINNQGFTLNGEGRYPVKFGPAMRRVIDFADPESTWSVLPTGQSGNMMSPHYSDQAAMYAEGKFRKQMMNRKEIEDTKKSRMVLRSASRQLN